MVVGNLSLSRASRSLRVGLLLFPLALFLPVGEPSASTQSEILRTQAVDKFNRGELGEALQLLDRALQEDAADLRSRYYRGVVHSREGNLQQAKNDLLAVARSNPSYQNLRYELAFVQLREGEFSEAQSLLEQDIEQDPHKRASRFLLGVVKYKRALYGEQMLVGDKARADNIEAARAGLEIAGSLAESRAESRLVSLLRDELQALQLPERSWRLRLAGGGSYDSNVGFFSDEGSLPSGVEGMADWRSLLTVEGEWVLLRERSVESVLSYRYFQSNHSDLTDYDTRAHTATFDYRHNFSRYLLGLNYLYADYTLGGDGYRHSHILSPLAMLKHPGGRSSFIKLKLRQDDYLLVQHDGRDGRGFEFDYRHYRIQGTRSYQYLGVLYGADDTEDPNFDSEKYGMRGGIQRRWRQGAWKADIEYLRREFSVALPARSENYLKGRAVLMQPLTKKLDAILSLTVINNASDQSDYDFTRNMADVVLRWEL